MKEVDRSWDMDSEDVYSVNGKKYTARGETVNAPDDIAEAIEASKVEYEKRKVPPIGLSPEEIAQIVAQIDVGPEVEANPTLDGTESDLEGLKIGTTKFKIPEGSGGGATIDEIKSTVNKSKLSPQIPSLVISANDELAYKPDTTQYILLYVDDARTDLPDIWDIVSEYNIPLNLAVPSDHLNYNCNNGVKMKTFLHTLEDAGCEILSHARSESDILNVNSTRAQVYAWLKESKEALLAEGYKVHGFIEAGGGGQVTYNSKEMGDLVRMFYEYSDTKVYPSGINKGRTSLYTQGVTIDSLLKSIGRGQNARKFFCHNIGGDVTEEYLREFIETAIEGGYVFTTEYEYYQTHAYSILDDRLKRLEKNLGRYNTLDSFLFHQGWGRPSYDEETYPYALILSSGDARLYASNAPLIKDITGSTTVLRKSDSTSFSYKRWRYASGEWISEKDESVTSIDTFLAKNVNPSASNYKVYDSSDTLVRDTSDYYDY